MWVIVRTSYSSSYSGIPRLCTDVYGPFASRLKAENFLKGIPEVDGQQHTVQEMWPVD